MKTGIIIQARMTSTRLPGKILKEILGKPLLFFQLERMKRIEGVDQIIIATTINHTDDVVTEFCEKNDVEFFRGSETDVLSRYYEAAKQFQLTDIVRLTADCPLIDPEISSQVVKKYQGDGEYDYVSNILTRTFPRGLDTEIFSFKALEAVFLEATLESDREHVTPFIYNNPKRFNLGGVTLPKNLSRYRLTVDTPEDFTLIEKILETCYVRNRNFLLKDILDLFERDSSLSELNKHVEQKKL